MYEQIFLSNKIQSFYPRLKKDFLKLRIDLRKYPQNMTDKF